MSRKILVLILVVLAASGAAFYYARSNRARGVVLTGIVTTDEIVVSSQIQGQINQLLVKEGDTVKGEVDRFRSLCLKRHGRAFSKLSLPEKDKFLTYLIGSSLSSDERPAARFFYRIRELTLHAYYTGSPQGLFQELGYTGNAYLTEFKGCTHPEHKG